MSQPPPRRSGAVARGSTSAASKMKTSGAVPKTSSQSQSRAVVPRSGGGAAARATQPNDQVMLAPKGYTMRVVQPAKNYDVVSFARAMNDDLGPKVKKLFDAEREASLEAQQTGIYIGWRCPEYKWDCQRVGRSSRCFCGHLLAEHDKYNGQSVRVPCRQPSCICKAFAWIASRPEDVGEFWLPKRRDFDPTTWRMTCRCKHTHEEHDPNGQHRCRKCGCAIFSSSSVCAACDRHWEEHETFFDTTATRREKGLPFGSDHLPFAEIPTLRNMVLTGEDDGDISYVRLQERQLAPGRAAALPAPPSDSSNAPVPYRGTSRGRVQCVGCQPGVSGSTGRDDGQNQWPNQGSGGGQGGSQARFRPVYD